MTPVVLTSCVLGCPVTPVKVVELD